MKKTFFLSIMLMLGISAFAQKAEIAFETKSYDFGEVKEENGPVSTFFEFKNTGQLPLVLNSVTAPLRHGLKNRSNQAILEA